MYGTEVWLRVCVAWILYMRRGVCEVSACSVITEPTPQLGERRKRIPMRSAVSKSYSQPDFLHASLRVCGL